MKDLKKEGENFDSIKWNFRIKVVKLKYLTNYFKKIYNILFSPSSGPSDESLFNIAVECGIFACLVIFIMCFVFKFGYIPVIVTVASLIIIILTYLLSNHFKKYKMGSYVLIFMLNFIVFPYSFILLGGVNGGLTSAFILGIVSTILLIDGITMMITVGIEFVYYGLVYYFAFKFPDKIINFPNDFQVYRASYAYMVIAALFIGIVIKILLNEYQKEGVRVKSLLQQVQELSVKDPLTTVYNRRYMLDFLDQKINQSKTEESPLCIIMFDIDYFKRINDTYGHVIGDEVLKQICKIFLDSCRKDDIVARYGGEEFLIILPSTEIEIAVKRAEQIRVSVNEKVQVDNLNEKITLSGGVVSFNNSDDIVEFIKKVDEKLYIAKSNGRNQIVK